MGFLTGLIRFILIGLVVGALIGIGFFFFTVVSVVLLVFGSIAWLKQKDVLRDPRAVPPMDYAPAEVIVERKVIEAEYEELGKK